jgi:hypothetical protein
MDITYKIRHIKDGQDKDISYLLKLYAENIDPSIRTNTNEILYWLNHFEERQGNDTFWILALYLNKKPVGFCQTVHFHFHKILFIDYCVIDPDFRVRAFSEYTHLIRDFFADINIDINYYVTEIAYYSSDNNPSQNALKLIRLLKMSGFKVIKAPYAQPELGLNNFESEMKATLMIYVTGKNNDCPTLKKDTYFDIVRTIFYDHYIRWYDTFMTENEKFIYHKKIDELFDTIKKETNKHKSVQLNSEPYLFEQSEQKPPRNSNKKTVILLVISLIIIYFVISGLSLFFEKQFNITTETQFNNWKISGILTSIVLIIWVASIKDLRKLFLEWITNLTTK